ncbi:VanZ family protein [Pengzhenrongella sp.]|uniref:VanZ family protein n=1 Tax=Pengzhenrongella sp. TaxID=2888820 RepID=UPI0039C9EFBA
MLQLASGRSADVDDVILNTAGAAAGTLLCLLAARLRQQRHSRRKVLVEPPRPTTAT